MVELTGSQQEGTTKHKRCRWYDIVYIYYIKSHLCILKLNFILNITMMIKYHLLEAISKGVCKVFSKRDQRQTPSLLWKAITLSVTPTPGTATASRRDSLNDSTSENVNPAIIKAAKWYPAIFVYNAVSGNLLLETIVFCHTYVTVIWFSSTASTTKIGSMIKHSNSAKFVNLILLLIFNHSFHGSTSKARK